MMLIKAFFERTIFILFITCCHGVCYSQTVDLTYGGLIDAGSTPPRISVFSNSNMLLFDDVNKGVFSVGWFDDGFEPAIEVLNVQSNTQLVDFMTSFNVISETAFDNIGFMDSSTIFSNNGQYTGKRIYYIILSGVTALSAASAADEFAVMTDSSFNLIPNGGDPIPSELFVRSLTFDQVLKGGSTLNVNMDGDLNGYLGNIYSTVPFSNDYGNIIEEIDYQKVKDIFLDKELLNDALNSDPDNPRYNYLKVYWVLVEMLESNEFKVLLSSLGFSVEIFDLTLDALMTDGSDEDIEFYLNTEFSIEEIRTYVLEDVLPNLDTLDNRFTTIAQDEVVLLYDDTEFEKDIYVDYADSLVFRALTKFLTSVIRIELAYRPQNLNTITLSEFYYSGVLTTEYIRDLYPEYGSVYDVASLASASIDLKAAINLYQEASPLLRNVNRTEGFFLLNQEDLSGEEELFNNLTKLELTLEGQHAWGDNIADLVFINLEPFFQGEVDLSIFLPQSYGNFYKDEPLHDPTFGGVFPTFTDFRARELMNDAGMLTSNLWIGTMPMSGNEYWWEPQWWRSHWFGTFYREANDGAFEFDNRSFPSNWMFHMWLGWIYPAVATPESVWIWQEDSESWIWTNKELFPILYSHTSGLWFYVSQEDGSQYIWLNGEWVFFK